MIDLEHYIQDVYDKLGLEESKRRLLRFYLAYLELYRELLPDVAKVMLEAESRHQSGEVTLQELSSLRAACIQWNMAHGGPFNPNPAYYAAKAALFVAFEGSGITTDDQLHYELSLFLHFTNQAADHSADLERCLRKAFESP